MGSPRSFKQGRRFTPEGHRLSGLSSQRHGPSLGQQTRPGGSCRGQQTTERVAESGMGAIGVEPFKGAPSTAALHLARFTMGFSWSLRGGTSASLKGNRLHAYLDAGKSEALHVKDQGTRTRREDGDWMRGSRGVATPSMTSICLQALAVAIEVLSLEQLLAAVKCGALFCVTVQFGSTV